MDPSVVHWDPKDLQVLREYLLPLLWPSKECTSQTEEKAGRTSCHPLLGADVLTNARYSSVRDIEADIALTETLGSGASGDVRLGEWRDAHGFCAVKSIAKDGNAAAPLAEITAEVELLLSMEHPQIVRLERIYESETHVHLVMEHLDGGELFDRIFEVGFTESEASAEFQHMMLAVAFLHQRRVLHGDLKPENFVYKRGEPEVLKLIDFGFAKRLPEDGGKLKAGRGSLHYVSPEVLAGSYDERADLWSMGVVLHVMLCGDSPWPGSDAQVLQRISAAQPRFEPQTWARLSPGARTLIESLLCASLAQRPSAEQVLLHPWLNRKVLSPCSTLSSQGLSVGSKTIADDASHANAEAQLVFREFDKPKLPAAVKLGFPGARFWLAWLELCILTFQRAFATRLSSKDKLGTVARLPSAFCFLKIISLRMFIEFVAPGWRPVKNAVLMLAKLGPWAVI